MASGGSATESHPDAEAGLAGSAQSRGGGGAITVRDGKYGPYVNWGKVNATLPKGTDPQAITVEEALALIAAKAGKSGGTTKKAPAKAKTAAAGAKATKTTAKPKAAAKKPAAKTAAKKKSAE